MEKIYQQVWIDLPKATRHHLVKVFGLVPNGIAEIRDTTVISDGFTNDDLSRISALKMAEYVGGGADSFSRLWELTLAKVKYELNPPINFPQSSPQTIESALVPMAQIPTSFCDKCESHGVRHLKICPRYIPIRGK